MCRASFAYPPIREFAPDLQRGITGSMMQEDRFAKSDVLIWGRHALATMIACPARGVRWAYHGQRREEEMHGGRRPCGCERRFHARALCTVPRWRTAAPLHLSPRHGGRCGARTRSGARHLLRAVAGAAG